MQSLNLRDLWAFPFLAGDEMGRFPLRFFETLHLGISYRNHDQSTPTLPDAIIEDTSEEPILCGAQDKFLQIMKLVEEDFDEPSEKAGMSPGY